MLTNCKKELKILDFVKMEKKIHANVECNIKKKLKYLFLFIMLYDANNC